MYLTPVYYSIIKYVQINAITKIELKKIGEIEIILLSYKQCKNIF